MNQHFGQLHSSLQNTSSSATWDGKCQSTNIFMSCHCPAPSTFQKKAKMHIHNFVYLTIFYKVWLVFIFRSINLPVNSYQFQSRRKASQQHDAAIAIFYNSNVLRLMCLTMNFKIDLI